MNAGDAAHSPMPAHLPAPAPATSHFSRLDDRRLMPSKVSTERRALNRRAEDFRWIALFSDCEPDELAQALADCEVLALPAGRVLLRYGARNENVFILLSGRLSVHLGPDAQPTPGISLFPGECVGELSAIDAKPISALVLAATDVRVLRLSGQVFWKRIIKLRGVAENLMTTLSERMRRSNTISLEIQRERLELLHLKKELDVARQLQASMLPLQRPLFAGRTDIEACGFMEPASKVGGDLFDAFFVDNRMLFICIGDVSGHGIAAALFMVRVIGLLRSLAMDNPQPDKVLEALNERLCIGNDTHLFVTVFCGFLDVQSGRLVYSNAGHCPPLVCSSTAATLLPLPKGILAGAASGKRFTSMEHQLAIGETLLCYTDGMTEAENSAGVPFSEQGCIDFMRQTTQAVAPAKTGAVKPPSGMPFLPPFAKPLPDLLDALYQQVVGHTGLQRPADDCTILAVRRVAA